MKKLVSLIHPSSVLRKYHLFLKQKGGVFLSLLGSFNIMGRWIKPEVYPLFAAVGTVVGICAMQLVRNITTNPEVRVNKQNRAAGVLENFDEGERYAEHAVRKFVRGRRPEVMPSLNKYFSDKP